MDNGMFGNRVSINIDDKVFEKKAHKHYIYCEGNVISDDCKFEKTILSSLNNRLSRDNHDKIRS